MMHTSFVVLAVYGFRSILAHYDLAHYDPDLSTMVGDDDAEEVQIPRWTLVKAKRECAGSEMKIGMVPSIGACAEACKDFSSMFAFGTNDYGNSRCSGCPGCSGNPKCQCLCETSASSDGTCKEVRHTGYRLYKYGIGDEKSLTVKEEDIKGIVHDIKTTLDKLFCDAIKNPVKYSVCTKILCKIFKLC